MDYQDVCLPADGAGRRGAATDRNASRDRGSVRSETRGGSAAPPSAGVFALAAIPARYALERQAWAEAAKLELRPSRFPQADAITWFARGLGAARTGDLADRPRGDRRPAAARGAAHEGGRGLLGRAGRRFSGSASPRGRRSRTARRTKALTTMRSGGRPRGPDREECGHAGTDRARARAPRLHAARGRSAGGCPRGVRDDAQEGAEQVPARSPARPTPRARKAIWPRAGSYAQQLLTVAAHADASARPQLASARETRLIKQE